MLGGVGRSSEVLGGVVRNVGRCWEELGGISITKDLAYTHFHNYN